MVEAPVVRRVDRYALFDELGCGGMATVYLARRVGATGFSRAIAVKRMHPHLTRDGEFVAMLLDEARIAARVRHPNVVSIVDVVGERDELLLVMEFVNGERLSSLIRPLGGTSETIPLPIVSAIMHDLLEGLEAAHEATDEVGNALGIVHRDVSPQNVLVGVDGRTRVIDFGVAKAAGRLIATRNDKVKGKVAYMAPEQLRRGAVTRRADVYSASVVLWEMLVLRRLFAGDEAEVLEQVLLGDIPPPSRSVRHVPRALEDVVMKGLAADPEARFDSARAMALALTAAVTPASAFEVADWANRIAGDSFRARAAAAQRVEQASLFDDPTAANAASGSLRGVTSSRSPLRWAAYASAIGAAIAVALIAAAARSGGKPTSEAPASAQLSASGPGEAPAAVPTSAVASASPTNDPEPQPAPSLRAQPASHAPGVRRAQPVTGARSVACNPPYRRDASGVKVWIPECAR